MPVVLKREVDAREAAACRPNIHIEDQVDVSASQCAGCPRERRCLHCEGAEDEDL